MAERQAAKRVPYLSLAEFQSAHEVARPHIHRTPVMHSTTLSTLAGAEVFLKAECLQKTGSYKIRGPLNVLDGVGPDDRRRGVICASAGNHAQGVAYAAAIHGIPATVVMAENATPSKIAATRGYGAKVILHGQIWDDAYEKSLEIQKRERLLYIHPFDDLALIAGQGTLGLEIMQDVPGATVLIVPIGGGGLISGVAMAAKAMNPSVRVIGVQSSGAPTMKQSVAQGQQITLTTVESVVDGLVVKRVGENTLSIVRRFVDDIVLVSDEEIFETIVWVMAHCKLVVEGAAAATVAALMLGRVPTPARGSVVCLLSGGNIKLDRLYGQRWN